MTNSKENPHQKPYGLNTIVEVLGLFWFFGYLYNLLVLTIRVIQ